MVAFIGKAKDSVLEAFKQAVAHFKHWGHEVKSFRSDAETVLKDGKMGSYLEENGYIHELSSPEAHSNKTSLKGTYRRLASLPVPCYMVRIVEFSLIPVRRPDRRHPARGLTVVHPVDWIG